MIIYSRSCPLEASSSTRVWIWFAGRYAELKPSAVLWAWKRWVKKYAICNLTRSTNGKFFLAAPNKKNKCAKQLQIKKTCVLAMSLPCLLKIKSSWPNLPYLDSPYASRMSGPVNWMAPELLRGHRPRQASDVHSLLGRVAFFGRIPVILRSELWKLGTKWRDVHMQVWNGMDIQYSNIG